MGNYAVGASTEGKRSMSRKVWKSLSRDVKLDVPSQRRNMRLRDWEIETRAIDTSSAGC